MDKEEVKARLCAYDTRNPDGLAEDYKNTGETMPAPRINCYCDNCFYGRDALAVYCLEILNERETTA